MGKLLLQKSSYGVTPADGLTDAISLILSDAVLVIRVRRREETHGAGRTDGGKFFCVIMFAMFFCAYRESFALLNGGVLPAQESLRAAEKLVSG